MSGSKRISELTTASVITGAELMVVVQDGETRQAEVTLLRTLAPVIAVNGETGSVLLTVGNIPGLEPLVVNAAVSAAIASVSARVDALDVVVSTNYQAAVSAAASVSVRVDTVSAAITSVQDYVLAQISAATSGVFTEAPNDGQIYGRQSLAWVPVSITALQSQINTVSALASAALFIQVSGSTTGVTYVRQNAGWIPLRITYDFNFAASDEATALTTGTAIEFSFPRTMAISDIVLEVNSAPTSVTSTFVVRTSVSSLHGGQIHIDPLQRTSRTAAVATSIAITTVTQWTRGYVDVSIADATITGLKVYILGTVSV